MHYVIGTNVVVIECSTIFKLLAVEDESLLVRRDSFHVMYHALDILYSCFAANVQRDLLASERPNGNLEALTLAHGQRYLPEFNCMRDLIDDPLCHEETG